MLLIFALSFRNPFFIMTAKQGTALLGQNKLGDVQQAGQLRWSWRSEIEARYRATHLAFPLRPRMNAKKCAIIIWHVSIVLFFGPCLFL